MILLDTNAVIWLIHGHRRVLALRDRPRLHVSPATLLEMQILAESGKLRLMEGRSVLAVAADPRYTIDEPAAARWFEQAVEVSWTRDPFDRLIVAHARVRGWKLATADRHLVERLRPSEVLAL